MKHLLLPLSLCLATTCVQADQVENQINMGLEAYSNKEYQVAIDELQYAIAEIRELLNAENAQLLPEAPEGWNSSAVENNSAGMALMGGGTHMARSYDSGGKSVEVTILTGAMAGSLAMLSNPMFISNNPNMKPYRYQRYKGVQEQNDTQSKITLGIAGQIMIQLSGSGGATQEDLEMILGMMDFPAIQAALLQ